MKPAVISDKQHYVFSESILLNDVANNFVCHLQAKVKANVKLLGATLMMIKKILRHI